MLNSKRHIPSEQYLSKQEAFQIPAQQTTIPALQSVSRCFCLRQTTNVYFTKLYYFTLYLLRSLFRVKNVGLRSINKPADQNNNTSTHIPCGAWPKQQHLHTHPLRSLAKTTTPPHTSPAEPGQNNNTSTHIPCGAWHDKQLHSPALPAGLKEYWQIE